MENNNQNLMIPGAIILAGVIIAGAVIYSSGSVPSGSPDSLSAGDGSNTGERAVENINPVSDNDHIRGNKSAQIVVIEFSDLECPFCKSFHSTMKQVVESYGDKVAWVYRHFPLANRHSKAQREAEATECANDLGGNDAFWAFTDRIFEITPSNNGLDLDELPRIAEFIGLDASSFRECLDSEKYKEHVLNDYRDAVNSGGTGTPYSVVVARSGKKAIIPGALQYDQVKQIIDGVLEAE